MHVIAKQFSKQKYSFQNRNIIFKTEIQFSNHKSSEKSVCFQITYTEILGVGPLEQVRTRRVFAQTVTYMIICQ